MISHSATPGKHFTPHHTAPKRRPEPGSGFHKTLVVVALIAIMTALGMAALMMRPKGQPAAATPEAFIDQMERAAEGGAVGTNLFGGAMVVERRGNRVTITASSVPPNVCVAAGWALVRKGVLTINGTTPLRVSGARLSELCNQDSTSATLAWAPKATE